MTHVQRYISTTLLIALVVGGSACATSIRDVMADPARYRDREVTIAGDVIDSYSIIGQGVYQLQDNTGRLWIASNHGVPRKGARVKVTGTIREGVNIGKLADLVKLPSGGLIMIESEHKVR